MPWYCSFLVFSPEETELVRSICKEAGWRSDFILDPSRRYRFKEGGFSEAHKPEATIARMPLRPNEKYGKLLILEGDPEDVENIVDLVHSSVLILTAFHEENDGYTGIFELPEDSKRRWEIARRVFRSDGYFQSFRYWLEMPTALALAGAAWGRKSEVYAIHKLAASIRAECVTPHSMHPRYRQVFPKHTHLHLRHVGTSTAINLAFSAIQELGLDVKSSPQNPRWKDSKKHEWNPTVLHDLQKRLKAAGVDTQDKIEWVSRGLPTEVEVHPLRDMPSEYSDGENIRDVKYTFPDAINACEYLRNYMTAHAFGKDTTRLGPYEVYNVQQVARQLILKKLGLWRTCAKDLKRQFGN